MASSSNNTDGSSEDSHAVTGVSSKKSISPGEMMKSDQAVKDEKPPAVPPNNSLTKPPLVAGNTARPPSETASSVYIRADGKKVRRVKKRGQSLGSVASSATSDEETIGSKSTMGSSSGSVYIRADGKRVRRVKRRPKKLKGKDQDIPAQVSITSPSASSNGADAPAELSTSDEDEKDDAIEAAGDSLKEKEKVEVVLNEGAKTVVISNSKSETDQKMDAKLDKQDEMKNKPVPSIDADAISTKSESVGKQETDSAEKRTTDNSVVVRSDDTSEAHSKPTPTDGSHATVSSGSKADGTDAQLVAADEKALESPSGGSESLSENNDSDNPWLVEPNDLEKEEEQSQDEEVAEEEEEETPVPIIPVVEEVTANVVGTNKSIIHEEEPSVEQKMDSFEEFVSLVESEEIPKKDETAIEQTQSSVDKKSQQNPPAIQHDEDTTAIVKTQSSEGEKELLQTSSTIKHDEDISVEQTNSLEEFVAQVESEEIPKIEEKKEDKELLQTSSTIRHDEDISFELTKSLEEFVTQVESEEMPKIEEKKEDKELLQTSSTIRHDDDISVEQTKSLEEFVTQVESEEIPKIEENKDVPPEDSFLQKEENLTSPHSAHAVIVDVHVTSVTRNPADSYSAPIEGSAGSVASSTDKYAFESQPQEPNLLGTSGQGERMTVDPIQTSISSVSEQAVLKPDDSYGGGNLVIFPSTDAVSPKGMEEDTASELEGGRLWFAAMRQANEASQSAPSTPNRRRLPETLMERTRSRADVDTFVRPRTPISPKDPYRSGALVRLDDDDLNLNQTAFAHKRVRVVQLLLFGLIGLAFGLLGSFYVQSSCHFLTATVAVGNNEEEFNLHYGMWKYTPLSSAFDGYSYCYSYDGQYTTDSPIIPRIVGITALLLGGYTLAVLWVYLVLGRTDFVHWKRAIYASGVSGVFQSLTLFFFAGSVCQRNSCSVGPGAVVSIFSTLTWFVLAFEMHYNTPIMMADEHDDGVNSPDGIVASLEMSDVEDGVTAFFRRATNARGEDIPTLNQFTCRKEKVIDSPVRRSYVPPAYFGESA